MRIFRFLKVLYIFLAISLIFPRLCLAEKKQEGSFLLFTSPINAGMFAIFSSVLAALDLYDQGEFEGIKIHLNSSNYLDQNLGPNWWEYFFEAINIGNQDSPKYTSSVEDILSLASNGFSLSRRRAFELIQKYVHIQPHIKKELDTFVENNFEGYFVIGVHHRGTDKKFEVPMVPYEKTVSTVNAVIKNLSENQKQRLRLYVATDDQKFLNYFITIFPDIVIYNDFIRSKDENSLHYSTNLYNSNYQKGKEAILDCLLLSKCQILLRPLSSLSHMSANFNPDMLVFILLGI